MNSSQTEPGESVIFQLVLQAYPTRHSWIVTAHVSLEKFGMQLETLQETTHKDSTIPQILRTTSISTNTTAYYTPVGII